MQRDFAQRFDDSRSEVYEPGQGGFGGAEVPLSGYVEGPIQLVRVDSSRRLQVCQEAIRFLVSLEQEVCFVCITGKYRTGKSFLMNKLLRTKEGFRVDSTTRACTQGLWFWGKPLSDSEEKAVFLMDCEGTESTDRDSSYDAKLFSLSLLISSVVLFNSVGVIDETAIAQLGLVSSISKHVVRDSTEHLMPKFLWLLRDFTLRLEDERGKPLTPNQYLERCLHSEAGGRTAESGNRVRREILATFSDRQCLTMVRPVYEDSKLKQLKNLPDSELRPQFLEVVQSLRQKLTRKAIPKRVKGRGLSGKIFADLVLSYVNTLNSDRACSVSSAWEQIVEDACIQAYNEALQKYMCFISVNLQRDVTKSEQQLYFLLAKMREDAAAQYRGSGDLVGSPVFEKYRAKLAEFVEEKQKAIYRLNNELNRKQCQEAVVQLSKEFKEKLVRKSMQSPKEMEIQFNKFLRSYDSSVKGPAKAEVLLEYLQGLNPIIIEYFSGNGGSPEQLEVVRRTMEGEKSQLRMKVQQAETKDQDAQRKIKNLEDNLRKSEEASKSFKQRLQMLQKELEESRGKKDCCLVF